MNLVKFSNGKYGIRKRSIFGWYVYRSFYGDFWWAKWLDKYNFRAFCQVDEDRARHEFILLKNTPVKITDEVIE